MSIINKIHTDTKKIDIQVHGDLDSKFFNSISSKINDNSSSYVPFFGEDNTVDVFDLDDFVTSDVMKGIIDTEKNAGINILGVFDTNDMDVDFVASSSVDTGIAQSFVVVGDYYVTCSVNSKSNKTCISIYDKNNKDKFVKQIITDFNHANGLTYNPNNGCIYVARNLNWQSIKSSDKYFGIGYEVLSDMLLDNSNEITCVDEVNNIFSLTVDRNRSFLLDSKFSGISYDKERNVFYASKADSIYIYDFPLSKDNKPTNIIKKVKSDTPQDIFGYDGYIYVPRYVKNSDDSEKNYNAIDIYHVDNGYQGSYIINSSYEIEGIDYDFNENKMLVYFNQFKSENDPVYSFGNMLIH